MGAAGSGMSGLARWLEWLGHDVDGCDRSGAGPWMEGHGEGHVAGIDLLVHTAAVPPDHPELAAARRTGIEVLRRSEMISRLLEGRVAVAVSGAHGKTTTAAMTGWVLQETGSDPLVLVGGDVPGWPSGFRPGGGPVVLEADEYDRAFLRFGHLHAAVSSFDAEHLECYGSIEALRFAFEVFLELSSPGGGVVVPVEEEGLARWAARLGRTVLTAGPGGLFDCVPGGPEGWGEAYTISGVGGTLGIPGLQNLRNAATCHALSSLLGLGAREVAGALAGFPGASRRLERMGTWEGRPVVSDYAHHPREIEASIEALRRVWTGPLTVLFEPHLFSRTGALARDMGAALALADESLVLPVYPARETPVRGVDNALVAGFAVSAGGRSRAVDPGGIVDALRRGGTGMIVFMGAGRSDAWARDLVGGRL